MEAATTLLTDLVKAEVELENLLGVQRVRNYPQQRAILPGDVRSQAEHDALEVRLWLGLGMAPVSDIITLLELQLGVRVFVRKLDGRIPESSSMMMPWAPPCCSMPATGAIGGHRQRRVELGHLVARVPSRRVARRRPGPGARGAIREIIRRWLPHARRAVMQQFQEVVAGSTHLTRRHVIVLAHVFGVSAEAMVRRLEQLKLTKPDSWDWFEAHGGITDEQVRQVLGDRFVTDVQRANSGHPTSLRLNLLAGEAWRRELLSEGQLARLLHLGRVELREMLDDLDDEDIEADEALALSV